MTKIKCADSYRQGYIDGSFEFMGYSMDQLIEIIVEHEKYQFYAGQQWTDLKERQKEVNNSQPIKADFTREYAIKHKCHGIAYPETLIQALEALGLIKFKEEETINLVMKALCAIMIETEVRSGPNYGVLYTAYPSEFGAGCLIDGLRNKGYEIVKINQK
jgi:hypothetical protein